MELGSVNTETSVVDLTGGAADSFGWLSSSNFAGDALTVGGVESGAGFVDIDAFSICIQVLIGGAGLEVDTLTLFDAIVLVDAEDTETQIVDLETVVGNTDALSVDTPLVDSADCVERAASGVVEVISVVALIAVSGDKVVLLTVDLSTNAGSESESFSLFAAGEGTVELNALSVAIHAVVGVFAAETLSADFVVGVAED